MSREDLRETVAELHREIDAGEPLSQEQTRALSEALGEIEALLASSESDLGSTIISRLREAEVSFEDSHPHLTTAVRAVVNALSRLGI